MIIATETEEPQEIGITESQMFSIYSLMEHGGKQLEEQETKALKVELSGYVSQERASEIISFLKGETFNFKFK